MKISEMIRGSSMREAAAPLSGWVDDRGGDAEINAREWGSNKCKEAAKTLLKLDKVLQTALDQVLKEMEAAGIQWRVVYPPTTGNIGQDYTTAWVHIGARSAKGKVWPPDQIQKMKEIISKVAKLRSRAEYHG
jgi:hypothetical protein